MKDPDVILLQQHTSCVYWN